MSARTKFPVLVVQNSQFLTFFLLDVDPEYKQQTNVTIPFGAIRTNFYMYSHVYMNWKKIFDLPYLNGVEIINFCAV